MRLYVEVAKRAFARQTTYRAANLAGLATNSFFGILRTYLFIGLYGSREVESGWSLADAILFVWIGQALITPIYMNKPELIGTFGWMDSAILAAAGIPTVIYGPSGEGAHAVVEWVALDDLERGKDVLVATAQAFCS